MQKQVKAKLKKIIKLEAKRLIELYAIEPLDSKEIERSVRIIKAAVDALYRLEKQDANKQTDNIKIQLILDDED